MESYGSFVEHPATSTMVKAHLQASSKMCMMHDLTILGVMESPKMKPSERYSNPRQRISGVASWGHFSETVMLVEPIPGSESSPQRVLHICPRNGQALEIPMEFKEDGWLHELEAKLEVNSTLRKLERFSK
jgi:hypothetical protein